MGTIRNVNLEGCDISPAKVEGLQETFNSPLFTIAKSRFVCSLLYMYSKYTLTRYTTNLISPCIAMPLRPHHAIALAFIQPEPDSFFVVVDWLSSG